MPDSINPVDWWHSLEGGKIAEQRPPPPRADAPYPNLGSVPARPVPTDPATRASIASGLVADRANARYAGAAGPDPSSPAAAPQAFGRGTAPPPAAGDVAAASLPAATAPLRPLGPPQPPLPDRPATPPRPAPQGKVEAAPLEPLPAPAATPAASVAAPAAPPTAVPAPAATAAAATLPAGPPPAPNIPGVAVPAITAPTPAPTAPAPAPAPAPAARTDQVLVPFAPASTTILPDAQDALRNLARRRGAAPVDITGYGEAASGDPAAQAAALPMAMARARAIAAVLAASGVPSSLLRVNASAEGKGGVARLGN